MKIPLKIIPEGIAINISVKFNPRLRMTPKIMLFIVDTGSPKTIISEQFVIQYNIPLKNATFLENIKIASTTLDLCSIGSGSLFIRDIDGKNQEFAINPLKIGVCPRKDENSRLASQSLPSLLGMDFLRDYKLKLVVDPGKSIAYLEDSE